MSTIKSQNPDRPSETSPGVPFEIDGDDPQGRYLDLNPNLAEGKALQRTQDIDLDDPTQWITVVEDEEEFDPGTEKLKQQGWQVKTVSQLRQEVEHLATQSETR